MSKSLTLAKAEWSLVRNHLDALIDLPADRRAAHLAALDLAPNVAQQLQLLLDAAVEQGILDGETPTLDSPPQRPTFASLTNGARIGAFEIDRLIGRGGMGEVYLAHRQDAGFDQRVALKMLRVEAAEQGAMFEKERRLLARLEHPGIARLIDGGMAPDGRPFMAMEYVEGAPIDEYCRTGGIDLEGRLALFRSVCDAVSYAHARLVVHRDLKPSNIVIDLDGNPRLLDFGIATLLDDTALVPATTQAMLTPDYAAPEQLEGESASVATDVFALGVVLFELVTGKGPWRGEKNSVPAIIRRILHEDPPLPSKVAAHSGSPVPARQIVGDIDAIILKAMRRAPAERYQSVSDLAADVRRFQELKPVQARAGSTTYYMGRFVRRYRYGVAASGAALAALLLGAGGIAWQARETAIERDIAQSEARRSESINRMLTVMFRDTAASSAGQDATVRQMLDNTAAQLVGSLDTSARSATLITTLADLYVNMDDAVAADSLLRQAIDKGIGAGDVVAMAQLRLRLASTAAALGNTDEMGPLLDYAQNVFARAPARYRYEMVELNNGRAQLLRRTGDVPGAIALLRGNLDDAEVVYAENHRDLLTLYNNLLVYMVEANQLDAMPAVFTRADAALARTGQQASMQGLSITQLKGMRLLRLNRPGEAERIFADVAQQRRASFGESAGLSVDLLQLSRAKLAAGEFAEALPILTEARTMALEYLGPAAVPTLVMALGLAEAKAETGDVAGAAALLDEVAPMIEGGPPAGLLARGRAIVAIQQQRWADAQVAVGQAQEIFAALGPAGESYVAALPALRARIRR